MTERYLLDTSVLSTLAPERADATQAFVDWIKRQDRELHLSTVTVLEIEQGIAKLRDAGGARRAELNARWLDRVLDQFGGNVLVVDVTVARLGGRLSDRARAIGRHPGLADILIAATAESHSLTLLTRNVKHFTPLGIDAVDPLVNLPR